ncbi:cation efflux family-domain-containing protein [Phlyctochytrium arcticum]|nr:cation efflux family-domain-containing protein [Phlyctochytrium arcticum]
MLHSITIGGSNADLPLYKSTSAGYTELGYSSGKHRQGDYLGLVKRYVRSIISDKATRNIFFFLLLNISFTGVEFLYGWWTRSLGLTADAVHMLFDSTAIIFSLVASVIAKWASNERYTYGYGRVETLTGFINALALLFASWNIIWEAFERFYDPQIIEESNQLLVVSVLGLLVNLVGIFAFDHGHAHGHSHDHGMFLHILSDTLGSVGVIISSLLIKFYGWQWTDPLCSLFIAILTIASLWPLLKSSGQTLLQRVPLELDHQLTDAYRKVKSLEGVVSFSQAHFWELTQGRPVGTIKILMRPDVTDEEKLRMQVLGIFGEMGVRDMVVQMEKTPPIGGTSFVH